MRTADTGAHDQQVVNRRLARGFLAWQSEQKGCSQNTLYEYGNKLELFLDWVGSRRLGSLDVADLETWVSRGKVRGAGPRAASSKAHDVALLKSFYKWLVGRRFVDLTTDPTALLVGPKVHNINPKALDDDTWLAAWEHPTLTDPERVVLGMGFLMGLRREEMCALAPRHVAISRGQLVGFPRKGGGDDVLPYGSCLRLLSQHRKTRHLLPDPGSFLDPFHDMTRQRGSAACSWLLPWGDDPRARTAARRAGRGEEAHVPEGMTTPSTINKRVNRLLDRTGSPRFTPHALRHSFVTNLLRCDVPIHIVSRLANHSSVAITMRYVKTGTDPLADFLADTFNDDSPLVASRW